MYKYVILLKNSGNPLRFVSEFFAKKYTAVVIASIWTATILCVALAYHKSGSYLITSENDFFSSYLPHAERLLRGNFIIDVYRGPLYVFLLAGVKSIINNYLAAGIIISAFSSGIFLFYIFNLFKNMFSIRAAVTALFIIMFNPFFITYSYAPGTDMFFCALCAAAIFYLFSSRGNMYAGILLSGLFTALAFLTRYNSIFIPAALPFIIFFNKTFNKSRGRKAAVVFIFFLAFVTVTAPWGIYTFEKKGEIFYNENYRNIAISLGNTSNINWEDSWNRNMNNFHSVSDIFFKKPALLAETVSSNVLFHSVKDLFVLNTIPSGFLIMAGFFFFRKRKCTPGQAAFYILNILFFIILLPLFYDPRFSLFLLPFYSVGAYISLKHLSNKSAAAFAVLASVFLLFNLYISIDANKEAVKGEAEVKETAAAFFTAEQAKHSWVNTRVASRMPHISYQLNMRWNEIPYEETLPPVLEKLKAEGVSYLYISTREITDRKEIAYLIDPSAAPRELIPVVYLPKIPAVLYRIK